MKLSNERRISILKLQLKNGLSMVYWNEPKRPIKLNHFFHFVHNYHNWKQELENTQNNKVCIALVQRS